MKDSSFTNTLILLAVAQAVLLSPLPACSQPAEHPKPSSPRSEPIKIKLVIKDGKIEWGGKTVPATVGNVVQMLRDRIPDADFVLGPGVAQILIDDLTLRSADVRGALEAIAFATGNKVRFGGLERNIYALTPGPAAREPEKEVEAFNLSPILDPLGPRDSKPVRRRIEEISSLLLSTFESFDARTRRERGKPLLNFNESTGLLVIIAHPEQLQIARKIVQALIAPLRSPLQDLSIPGSATPQTQSESDPRR